VFVFNTCFLRLKLQEWDVITKINGKKLNSADDLYIALTAFNEMDITFIAAENFDVNSTLTKTTIQWAFIQAMHQNYIRFVIKFLLIGFQNICIK
jgi:hypothetical protein